MAWLPAQRRRARRWPAWWCWRCRWSSSLQFYAGYPLRVLTAQLSAWLLQVAGIAAERSGTSMLVQRPAGHRRRAVLGRADGLDGLLLRLRGGGAARRCATRAFLRRLPLVGVLVLVGNVLRNSVLVALEARPQGLDAAVHEGIGLAALAMVCAAVVAVMQGGAP